MLERKHLTEDEALNRLSLVAHALALLADSMGADIGAALNLLARNLDDCLAALDPEGR